MGITTEIQFENKVNANFTLAQVEGMLPQLKRHSFRLVQVNQQIHSLVRELKDLGHLPQSDDFTLDLEGDDELLLDRLSSLKAYLSLIKEEIRLIHDMGCQIKSLEDFTILWPATINGQDIYLTWTYGEEKVQSYCDKGNLAETKSLMGLLD